MNNTAARTKSLKRTAEGIRTAHGTIAGYRAMLEIAKAYKMESEIDRLEQSIVEYENDLEDQMDAAIEAGYTPEQIEAV